MRSLRSLAPLVPIIAAIGCASLKARQPPLDCGTRVTIFGEETRYPNATFSGGTSSRIGSSSTGRARDVWTRLQLVVTAVRGEGTAAHASSER